jgi:uncharacterized protein YqfB (UPF0267 family)
MRSCFKHATILIVLKVGCIEEYFTQKRRKITIKDTSNKIDVYVWGDKAERSFKSNEGLKIYAVETNFYKGRTIVNSTFDTEIGALTTERKEDICVIARNARFVIQ